MTKRRIMRALKINEISGVDVPAQEGATAVIMKRRGEPGYDPKNPNPKKKDRLEAKDVEKGAALTTANDGHTHLLSLVGHGGDPMNSGMTTWVDEHAHPWIRNEADAIVIGAASSDDGESHDHEIGEMSKDHVDPLNTDDAGKIGKSIGTKEDPMTKTTPTIEELQAQLAKANAVAALTDTEKAHYTTLDADAQDVFLAKSVDERKDIVAKIAKAAQEDDPLVYTTMDGIELRKSVGAGFIAMAQSNDGLRKQVEVLTKKDADTGYEKRAETELSHIPGDVATRAAMLKAVDSIEDEAQREAAHAALKAQNTVMAKAFTTVGHFSPTPQPGSPDDELDAMAKSYHAANPKLTYEQAYDDVLKTEQGGNLYAKSIN